MRIPVITSAQNALELNVAALDDQNLDRVRIILFGISMIRTVIAASSSTTVAARETKITSKVKRCV